MSEKTPNERVRTMLDERGIEYGTLLGPSPETVTYFDLPDGREVGYTDFGDGHTQLRVWDATPEQAIAATVGDGEGGRDEWRSVALGLFDSLEKADLEEAKRWLCDNELIRQEIAYGDAKAATVGAGTCHMEVHDNLYETEGMGEVWLECDECHWQMQLEPTTPRFKHCPNCGKRIVREVSE